MKEEFALTDAKFVRTKDELCFQEVLDSFVNAEKILIYTYNVSIFRSLLLNKLKAIGEHTEITIITNIPERRNIYDSEEKKEKAKHRIKDYLSILKPERIGSNVKVYFDFNNHSKIIATDKIAFVGSSNYSEASSNNQEAGFITQNAHFIDYLFDSVLSTITDDVLSYYENISSSIVVLMGDWNDKRSFYCEYRDSCYSLSGHGHKDAWFFMDTNNSFSLDIYNKIYRYYVDNDVLDLFITALEYYEIDQKTEFLNVIQDLKDKSQIIKRFLK